MSPLIHITFRREDAADLADRLEQRLVAAFGADAVTTDENIAPDEPASARLGQCRTLIVLAGPRWLDARSTRGRRIDDANDLVHQIIGEALDRRVRIVLIAANGAPLPQLYQVPLGLQGLLQADKLSLDAGSFEADCARILAHLGAPVADAQGAPVAYAGLWSGRSIGLVTLLAVAAFGLSFAGWHLGQMSAAPNSPMADPGSRPGAAAPKPAPATAPAASGRERIAALSDRDALLALSREQPGLEGLIGERLQGLGYVRVAAERGLRWLRPGGGEAFRDCAEVCPELVVVPAGRVVLGSPPDEIGRLANEDDGQEHRPEVVISAPFAIGRYEVTRGEFAAFISASGHKMAGGCHGWNGPTWNLDPERSWLAPGFAQTDRHPVVCVSWNDAKAYVAWLSARTGQAYGLISEAQWEYAARATTTGAFSFSGPLTAEKVNFDASTSFAGSPVGAHRKATVAVDAPGFAVNAWGLAHVHGNAWEWVEDCYRGDYAALPPTMLRSGLAREEGCSKATPEAPRALRGGSWFDAGRVVRSAIRIGVAPSMRNYDIGFRVARRL